MPFADVTQGYMQRWHIPGSTASTDLNTVPPIDDKSPKPASTLMSLADPNCILQRSSVKSLTEACLTRSHLYQPAHGRKKAWHQQLGHTRNNENRNTGISTRYSGRRRWLKHVCAVGRRFVWGPFLHSMFGLVRINTFGNSKSPCSSLEGTRRNFVELVGFPRWREEMQQLYSYSSFSISERLDQQARRLCSRARGRHSYPRCERKFPEI